MLDEQIFLAAIAQPTQAERAEYLNAACGDDRDLRRRVEELLASHDHPDSFLQHSPLLGLAETVDHQSVGGRLEIGATIGRYKLLQCLGQGGMGTVYMAQQTEPVKRTVAVKIIQQGMDSRDFLARFEAERQALALMDHPNIARVLDAGCTESGRPYFVMELVKGIPITKYCDENRLPPRERLRLFVQVCQAVQHAHQKGIIHRDLKPSNILVAQYDDRPVPKVIDFGVAKATHTRLTERTLVTLVGQIVGTLEYMSPEQAVLNQLDVDTRADIYSLGVLLYELLVGVTPLDQERMKSLAMEALLRAVREEEPPRPSVRLSRLGANATATAVYRRTDLDSLARTLRGDLDWIVMKALEKDRSRRYDTASSFAADVERFLNDDVVSARPASTLYRARKFVARNRGLVVSVCAICTALVLGSTVATWSWLHEKATSKQLQSILSRYQHELEMNALDSALSGKMNQAEMLVADAKSAELPDEAFIWLKAFVDLQAGRVGECIEALESMRENKQSLPVAAHATLAAAYLQGGRLNEYITTVVDLQGRIPTTYSDRLLLGEALIYVDVTTAIRLLEEAIGERESMTARSIYAFAMAAKAMVSTDKQLSQRAIVQIEAAEVFAPHIRRVREVSLYAHHVAMKQSSGSERDEHRRRALAAAQSGDFSPFGEILRALFFHDIGDSSQARISFIQAARRGGSEAACRLAALLFFEEPASALQVYRDLELPQNAYGIGGEAFLLALSPGNQQQAIKMCDDVTKRYTDFDFRVDLLCVCLLAGDTHVAERSRQLAPTSRGPFWLCDKILAYLANDVSVSKDVLLAGAASDPQGKHIAEYAIGVRMLSEGNRESAKEYLLRCANSSNFHSAYPFYARAILKQIEAVPGWPQWLPAKSQKTNEWHDVVQVGAVEAKDGDPK